LLASEWLLRAHGASGLAVANLLAESVRLAAALLYATRMLSIDGYALTDLRSGISRKAVGANVGKPVDVGPC
jgi:hypothetical protein